MNDAGSNPVAPVYIDKDGNPRVPNEDAEPQDDESAESDNLDASLQPGLYGNLQTLN